MNNLLQILTVVKDILTICSLIIASVIAILGLQTWRKQLTGKTEYDLARNILTGIYKIRDETKNVRDPAESKGEIIHALKKEGIEIEFSDKNFSAVSGQAVRSVRLSKLVAAYNELQIFRLQGEALWGTDFESLMKQLEQKSIQLDFSIRTYFDSFLWENKEEQREASKKYRSLVYGRDNDNYYKELDKIIKSLESKLKPYLFHK